MENNKEIETKIEAEIERIRRKYLDSADEINRDYNEAKALSTDYEGRQIYELLQNAQDANARNSQENLQNLQGTNAKNSQKNAQNSQEINLQISQNKNAQSAKNSQKANAQNASSKGFASSKECAEFKGGEVLIEFKNGILRVSNTGEAFSLEGFKSLLRPHDSPKTMQQNMIGCKGLGFRSLLSWAQKITVATKGVALEFSQSNAREFLQGLFAQKPQLKNELKKKNADEFPIAVLPCPKIINKEPQNPYTTSIEIVCKDSICNKVSEQIQALNMLELLFLKDLRRVHIITEAENKSFEKLQNNENVLIIERDENSQKENSRTSWRLFEKTGEIEVENDEQNSQNEKLAKAYEIIIAYDFSHTYDFSENENFLYSFFKTKTPLNFPALIHCTFELTSERNSLKSNNAANAELVGILADFLVEVAVEISNINKECNYEPLKLILAQEGGLKEYKFYELLRQKAKQKPIFPTIANHYISLQDSPKFSTKPFARVLNPASFSELLQVCEDENVKSFLEYNARISFYDY